MKAPTPARLLFIFLLISPLISESQNIGIGPSSFTPDPHSMLEIQSTTSGLLIPRMTEAQRSAISPTSSSDYGLLVYQTNNTSGFYYWNGSAWTYLQGGTGWLTTGNTSTNSGLNFLGTTDNVSLRFKTNNIERMVIDSNGYIGIGATSPTTLLSFGNNVNAQQLLLFDSPFDKYGFGIQPTELRIFSPDGPISETTFGSISRSDGTTYIEHMRINGEGNIGIGTTGPLAKLHVDGGTSISDTLFRLGYRFWVRGDGVVQWGNAADEGFLSWNGDTALIGGQGGKALGIFSNATERVRVALDGKVGIGTTSPRAALEVVQPSTDAGVLLSNSLTGHDFGFTLKNIAGVPSFAIGNITKNLQFQFVLDSSGYVGIGNTTPSERLNINGNLRFDVAGQKIYGSSGSASSHFIEPETSDGDINFASKGDITFNLDADNNFTSHAFMIHKDASDESGTQLFKVQENGNVGIGTSGPSEKLHVDGSIRLNGDMLFSAVNQKILRLSSANHFIQPETNDGDINLASKGDITFNLDSDNDATFHSFTIDKDASDESGPELFRVQENGNVGIGTSSPTVSLDVNGGARLGDPDTNDDGLLDSDGVTAVPGGTMRWDTSATKLQVYSGSAWVNLH